MPTPGTVLIIGAGPNSIGHSGECDQGAVEACRALKAAGHRIVAVDANPDAVLVGKDEAHEGYIEALTAETIARLIGIEKPDAVLPVFGGRPGLDLAVALNRAGALKENGTVLWGTAADVLLSLLDRNTLQAALTRIGCKTPPIFQVKNEQEALEKSQVLGFPVVLRCDDPNLIPDGLLIYNQEELSAQIALAAGETANRLTVETSLWNRRQVELEILRDVQGETRLAGTVEYLDAAGIHPGDAVAVCPPQTLTPALQKTLFAEAVKIATGLNLVGCATLRFAFPASGENAADVWTLAVHPRYTRTSALVAQSTGLPLAGIAAALVSGTQWPAIAGKYNIETKRDKEIGFPGADQTVAVKWPVWDFDRIGKIENRLGPRMQASGQAMGLGRSFKEAFQKAARGADPDGQGLVGRSSHNETRENLLERAAKPDSRRFFWLIEALKRGAETADISFRTHLHPWFVEQLRDIATLEDQLTSCRDHWPEAGILKQALKDGFGDAQIAGLLHRDATETIRHLDTVAPRSWRRSRHTGSSNFGIYFTSRDTAFDGTSPSQGSRIMILGSGAHRIGQGSEYDDGAFHAARVAHAKGLVPLLVNNNLASITTGSAIQGDVLCDPFTADELLSIVKRESPQGIIAQFCGPSQFQLIRDLYALGAPVLGTSLETLRLMRNREAFWLRMRELGIPQPAAASAGSAQEARRCAEEIGYPLLLTVPARSIKSQPMMDSAMLEQLLATLPITPEAPWFMEHFLEYAIEAQAEAVCDGTSAFVAAILEHIELAGVNAADSACVLPPYSISTRHVETMVAYAQKIAATLGIKGLLNIRFALYRDSVYLLEASCETCRNLGVVAKTTHLPLAELATRVILGESLADLAPKASFLPYFGVRAAVFPFRVFSELDPILGRQVRATGEVLAFGETFGMAYFKAQQAAGTPLPTEGSVLITVTDEDKPSILETARIFHEMGFKLLATRGTQAALAEHGIEAETVRKLGFGRPHLVDEIKNGKVQMVINTPSGKQSQEDDSYIRKAATRYRIANITTPASAVAAAKGIAARRKGEAALRPLSGYKGLIPKM